MKIDIKKDKHIVARAIADKFEQVINDKPDALICICAGHSPVEFLNIFCEDALNGVFDDSQFKFISLDEWVGLGPKDNGSCINDMSKYLLGPLKLKKGERMFFFNGQSDDLDKECRDAEEFIKKHGGIDLMLLGIGMNGHVGFNEPGSEFDSGVRIVELDSTSKTVGTKYFDKKQELKQGITLGMEQVLESEEVILMAVGEHKKEILSKAVKGNPTVDVPASVLQLHENAMVITDEAAGSELS